MTDTTLTPRERRLLELELVARFREFGRPATLGELFDGFEPSWAVAALARLLAGGFATADDAGRVTPTPKPAARTTQRNSGALPGSGLRQSNPCRPP